MHKFSMYVYFYSLHVSDNHLSITGEVWYQCDTWFMSLCVDDRLASQTILLMMGTWLPETCKEGKALPLQARSGGFQEVKVPTFRDNGTGWW